jgi:predicted RNA-binding Zn-ribbon protein involved in translation (DUF1610 family)
MAKQPPIDRAAGDEQLLASYLAHRDVPCTSCGYNLRGITSGTCPECGRPIVINITIRHFDRTTLPWFLAIILYAIAAGAFGFFAFMMGMLVLLEDGDETVLAGSIVTAFMFILTAAVLAGTIRKRHHFWTWRPARQWMVMASVLLLPLLFVIAMATAMAVLG